MLPMAKRKYRVVFKKTSPFVKAVILIAILLSTVALVTLHATIENSRQEYESMRQEAGMLEENNQGLADRIDEMGTLESIIQIAMERLGLVLPGTTIFGSGN
jgi:cell division protein FtsB